MKDKELVISKIKKIKEGGSSKLQIITDFDRTVSKHHDNGKPTLSSYCKCSTMGNINDFNLLFIYVLLLFLCFQN